MAADLSLLPDDVADAVRRAAPGWAERSLPGDGFGDAEERVRDAIAAAVRLSATSPLDERLSVRLHMLRLVGIGEDSFVLHEWLGRGRLTRHWETLGDYDREEWEFQRKTSVHADRIGGAPPRNDFLQAYEGRLGTEVGLVVEDRPWFATLETLRIHLGWKLEQRFASILKEIVPHSVTMRRTPVAGGAVVARLAVAVEADGREPLVRHLRRLRAHRIREASEAVAVGAVPLGPRTWILDEPGRPDQKTMVFSGPPAIDAVAFRTFLRDVRGMEGPADELSELEASVADVACAAWAAEIRIVADAFDAGSLSFLGGRTER